MFKEFDDFDTFYIDIKVKGRNFGILKDGNDEFLKIKECANFCLK